MAKTNDRNTFVVSTRWMKGQVNKSKVWYVNGFGKAARLRLTKPGAVEQFTTKAGRTITVMATDSKIDDGGIFLVGEKLVTIDKPEYVKG